MIQKSKQKEDNTARLEEIYDEFQTPILGMVLYFLMQLPYIQNYLLKSTIFVCRMDFIHYQVI